MAQERWLTLFGTDLNAEFEIDPFTLRQDVLASEKVSMRRREQSAGPLCSNFVAKLDRLCRLVSSSENGRNRFFP